jgi:hypothetical protein
MAAASSDPIRTRSRAKEPGQLGRSSEFFEFIKLIDSVALVEFKVVASTRINDCERRLKLAANGF